MIIKVMMVVLMIAATVIVWACAAVNRAENELADAQLEAAKRAKEEALQRKAEAEKICEELRKAIKEELR